MEDTKIQWHPGFVAAMNLEFAENRENLIFEKEYNLNTRPLQIDLLVIRKLCTEVIPKNIAYIFKTYNLFEIKGINTPHWISACLSLVFIIPKV